MPPGSLNFLDQAVDPTTGGVGLRAVFRKKVVIATYERAIQSGFREVSDGLVARRWLLERLASQKQELAAQQVRSNLATLHYRNGVASCLEVLDAERELFAIEQQTVRTRREQLTNAVNL